MCCKANRWIFIITDSNKGHLKPPMVKKSLMWFIESFLHDEIESKHKYDLMLRKALFCFYHIIILPSEYLLKCFKKIHFT